jgi:hypothetical protein
MVCNSIELRKWSISRARFATFAAYLLLPVCRMSSADNPAKIYNLLLEIKALASLYR